MFGASEEAVIMRFLAAAGKLAIKFRITIEESFGIVQKLLSLGFGTKYGETAPFSRYAPSGLVQWDRRAQARNEDSVLLPSDRVRTIGSMANHWHAGRIEIRERSLSRPARWVRLRRSNCRIWHSTW